MPNQLRGKKRTKNKKVQTFRALKKIDLKSDVSSQVSVEIFLLFVFGLLLIGLTFIQTSCFQYLGMPLRFPSDHLFAFFLAGVLISGFSFYKLTDVNGAVADLSRGVSYGLLMILLGVSLFLGFYDFGHATGHFWDDYAVCIIDPRNILDFHEYHLLFTIGDRDPLYSYVGAFIWWLFPTMKAVSIQRVISNFFSIVSLWLLYRVGREFSGKRLVGVLLVACFVVSKPVLVQYLTCMPALTMPMTVSLFLLFQMKVFKKPDLKHFIEWGIALAVGISGYNASRPWIVYLVLVTVGWLLWKQKGEKAELLSLGTVGFFGFGFLTFYLDRILFIWHQNPIAVGFGYNYWVWAVLQLLFLAIFLRGWFKTQNAPQRFYALGVGLVVLSVFVYPLTLSTAVMQKIAANSLLPTKLSGLFSLNFIHQLANKITSTLSCMFLIGPDRSDMNINPDPFFNYHGAVLAVIGIIGFLARPTWLKTFVFFSIWVGIIAHIMTGDPTSAKLIGATPSIFLLTALTLNECLTRLWGGFHRKSWMGYLFLTGLVAFGVWAGQSTFVWVYQKWFYGQGFNSCLAEAAAQDALSDRVYIEPDPGYGFMSITTQSVINDEVPTYVLEKANPIYVTTSQKRKNVVLIISPQSLNLIHQIKAEFPKAVWTPGWREMQSHQEAPYFYEVLITSDQIPQKSGKLFQYVDVGNQSMWTRKLYAVHFGLARGMIEHEDIKENLNPVWGDSGDLSISAEKTWDVPSDGYYEFSISTYNVVKFFVGNKLVFNLIPGDKVATQTRSIFLRQGPYRLHYLTEIRTLEMSKISVRNLKTNYSEVFE